MSKIFVVFASGQCGEFIISLLAGMKDPSRLEKLRVEDTGSCHLNRREEPEIVCRNTEKLKELVKTTTFSSNIIKAHVHIQDSGLLLEQYPDSKVIAMTPDFEWTNEQFLTNYMTKAVIAEWENYGKHSFNSDAGTDYESVNQIKYGDVQKVYEYLLTFNKELADSTTEKMNKEYPNRFFTIPINMLYNDRQNVLDMLQSISGYKVTQGVEDFYNLYISKQPCVDEFKKWWNSRKCHT